MLKQRSEELRRSQAQNHLLAVIVEIAQRSNQLADSVFPLANAFWQNFEADAVVFQLVENNLFTDIQAICGNGVGNLSDDPQSLQAIALAKSQINFDVGQDQSLRTSLAIAIVFREKVLGVLSMRWQRANAISLKDVAAIQQCADEVAIALTCIICLA